MSINPPSSQAKLFTKNDIYRLISCMFSRANEETWVTSRLSRDVHWFAYSGSSSTISVKY